MLNRVPRCSLKRLELTGMLTQRLRQRDFRTSGQLSDTHSKPPQWPASPRSQDPKGHLQRPGPMPLGDPQEQAEFQRLLRENAQREALEASQGKTHPDAPSKPSDLTDQPFEGDKNLETGEIGGPKGKEPTR